MIKQKTSKILIIVIATFVFLTFAGIILYSWQIKKKTAALISPKPSAEITKSPSLKIGLSPSPSLSPTISPSVSPTQESENFQVPQNETYLLSSKADSNGDGKDEMIVITKTADSKYHAYILSPDGNKLYDNPDLGQKPLRITTATYGAEEKYPSWMLIFTEESGSLAFIHWNGTKYEIPKDNTGI